MEILQWINILATVMIILIGLAIASIKKKMYGWLIALSYALYLVFDIIYTMNLAVDEMMVDVMLLIGVVLSLIAVWQIYKQK